MIIADRGFIQFLGPDFGFWFLGSSDRGSQRFSVHKKGQSPPPSTIPEAVEKVRSVCEEILTEYENSVRSVERCSKIKLDGSQGMVSGATVMSVDMIVWGLKRMTSLFSTLSFDGTNLLSCMTLGFERLHSTSHIKHPLL